MVAIKNMEMPKYCWDYDNDDNEDNVCPLFDFCKHRNMYGLNPGIKNDDCPLVEIEELKIYINKEEREKEFLKYYEIPQKVYTKDEVKKILSGLYIKIGKNKNGLSKDITTGMEISQAFIQFEIDELKRK